MSNRKLWVSILAGIMALIMLLGLAVTIIPTPAAGASLSALQDKLKDLQEDKKELDKEIKSLESELKDNKKDMQAMIDRKNTIDQQIFAMYEKVNNLNEQITTYTALIADTQAQLDAAQERLAALNQKNKERIRAMEEDGELSYWAVLFKANSFADLLDRMNMIEEIAAADQRRLKEMSEAAQEVAQTKETLEQERAGLEENKKQLEASQAELEAKRDEADKLLTDLIATGEEYEALLKEAEAAVGELNDKIADTKEDIKDAQTPAKPPAGGGDYVESNAKWLVPCTYRRFTSAYGWREDPIYGGRSFHYGVDLASPKGTPIIATRSGSVTFAKFSKSAGYYVRINHGDGFSSEYMHMTHYIVQTGDTVEAGQVIGYMGSTGLSTGSHLHFGILYQGSYVNPAYYISI